MAGAAGRLADFSPHVSRAGERPAIRPPPPPPPPPVVVSGCGLHRRRAGPVDFRRRREATHGTCRVESRTRKALALSESASTAWGVCGVEFAAWAGAGRPAETVCGDQASEPRRRARSARLPPRELRRQSRPRRPTGIANSVGALRAARARPGRALRPGRGPGPGRDGRLVLCTW